MAETDVAYATAADVEKILDASIELPATGSRERDNLEAALLEATDAVIGYLEREFEGDATDAPDDLVPDDVPGAVRRVTARVALRGFLEDPSAPGAESEVNLMGPFSHTINWSKEAQARSLYLTQGEKDRIARFRVDFSSTAGHVAMFDTESCSYGYYA